VASDKSETVTKERVRFFSMFFYISLSYFQLPLPKITVFTFNYIYFNYQIKGKLHHFKEPLQKTTDIKGDKYKGI